MPLSEQRKTEIKRLAYEGGEELTRAIALGEEAAEKHLQKIHAEIREFLTNSKDKDELDFFTQNWTRDGREWPIHLLVQNPYVDAGTLLRESQWIVETAKAQGHPIAIYVTNPTDSTCQLKSAYEPTQYGYRLLEMTPQEDTMTVVLTN